MLTVTFDRLKNVAQKYINDLAFGVPEVAELMAKVFSNSHWYRCFGLVCLLEGAEYI